MAFDTEQPQAEFAAAQERRAAHTRSARRRFSWIPWVVLVLVFAGYYVWTNRPVETNIAWGDDLAAAQRRARDRGTGVLVSFTLPGCPPCKLMDREVFSNRAVEEAVAKFEPVRLDVWENEQEAAAYGVNSAPTYVILRPDGEPVAGVVGYRPVNEFRRFLQDGAESVSEPAQAEADRSGAP